MLWHKKKKKKKKKNDDFATEYGGAKCIAEGAKIQKFAEMVIFFLVGT